MKPIKEAAIMWTDRNIYTWPTHADILEQTTTDKILFVLEGMEGFVDEAWKFYNRMESASIAWVMGQTKERVQFLQSYHLTK